MSFPWTLPESAQHMPHQLKPSVVCSKTAVAHLKNAVGRTAAAWQAEGGGGGGRVHISNILNVYIQVRALAPLFVIRHPAIYSERIVGKPWWIKPLLEVSRMILENAFYLY